ncbi:MAG: serine/threonine protein kinase [Sandaracinaceae bacterium]|nr:serine/threonine protein kinase [Sandaracinaceae bacterium]
MRADEGVEDESEGARDDDVGASHARGNGRRSDADEMAQTLRASGPGASGTHLAPGALLEGTYRVEELLGKGAMGAVYLVEHIALGTKFAAKIVAGTGGLDAASIARLRNEARMASAIDHDHIVRVTHLGTTESGNVFVVMERLHGEDLRARTQRHRDEAATSGDDLWLPDRDVRAIIGPVLSALDAAHAAGVVHRDLKPENVFLHERQGRIVPKIVDFGIGKQRAGDEDVRLTATGQIVGTPLYMAPEQTRSTSLVDHRADLYAMGVMMFELLTGRLPFEAAGVYEIVVKHVTEAPPDPRTFRPELPEALAALVLRCLAKKPEDRFQSAAELLEAWEDAWGLGDEVPVLASSRTSGRYERVSRVGSGGGARGSDAARAARSEPREDASAERGTVERSGARSRAETLAAPATVPPPADAPRPSAPGRWVALGVTGVLALGGLALALRGAWGSAPSAPDEPPAAESSAPSAPSAPTEPTEPTAATPEAPAAPAPTEEPGIVEAAPTAITRRLVSSPSGAEVFAAGERLGATPLDVALPDGRPRRVELRRRGYATVEHTIDPGDPEPIEVALPRRRAGSDAFPGLAPQ